MGQGAKALQRCVGVTETVLDCFVTWATTLEKLKNEGKLREVEETLGPLPQNGPEPRDKDGKE
jgi:hypothetical protein